MNINKLLSATISVAIAFTALSAFAQEATVSPSLTPGGSRKQVMQEIHKTIKGDRAQLKDDRGKLQEQKKEMQNEIRQNRENIKQRHQELKAQKKLIQQKVKECRVTFRLSIKDALKAKKDAIKAANGDRTAIKAAQDAYKVAVKKAVTDLKTCVQAIAASVPPLTSTSPSPTPTPTTTS